MSLSQTHPLSSSDAPSYVPPHAHPSAISGAPFSSGTRLGHRDRYRIEKVLGSGGFGEVYLARDMHLRRQCVVKRLKVDLAGTETNQRILIENFAREAELLVSLNTPGHPNIPEIYEYLDEQHSLVMKYVTGQSLHQLLNRRIDPLPEDEALRYVREVCAALVYMHTRLPEPVLHRDIKPANIILDVEDRVWVIDFGLAKASLAHVQHNGHGHTGAAGTLGFAPPEQWQGITEPQSDVFALAATLWMLLTNQRPPVVDEQAQLSLHQVNPGVRAETADLVQRGMAFHRAERPTAAQFLAALDTLLTRIEIPPPPAPSKPPELRAFGGRTDELAAYRAHLASTHLVVMTGLAGVGKTTLAAALAQQASDTDRVFWHTFHDGEGLDVILWQLAAFLAWHGQSDVWELLQRARQTGGQPPPPEVLFDYIIQLLRGQDYLLCFDDFQCVDDDPLVSKFVQQLQSAVQASVIVTSRRVPAFAVVAETTPLEGLSAADVRTLLVQRGVDLADDLAYQLYLRTGGNAQFLTLAIDALRRATNPARLIDHLPEADEIERYLLREVDRRLTEDERVVMGALAVLLDYGGTRDAIEAVLDQSGLRRVLSDLSGRNLLIVVDCEQGREYVQHVMVQGFYYDALSKRERRTLHRRASAYYEAEEVDLLKAARHAQRAGDYDHAAQQLTSDIWSFVNQGQTRALHTLLAQFEAEQLAPDMWIKVLTARGELSALLGDIGQARAAYEETLRLLEELPDEAAVRITRAQACYGMGASLEYDAPREALDWLRRGLTLVDGLDDRESAALYIKIGTVSMPLGDFQGARVALERGQELLPEGPSQLRINALHTLGTLYSSQGDIERGKALTQQGLELCEQLRDYVRMAKMLSNLGIDILISGALAEAISYFERALELAERTGNSSLQLVVDLNMGIAYARKGDNTAALRLLQQGVAMAHELNVRVFEITGRASLADLYVRQGDVASANNELVAAERLAHEVDAKFQLPEIYRIWALVHLAQADLHQAHESIERSLTLAREMRLDTDEGIGLRVQGQVLLAQGRREEALTAFERSLALLDSNDVYEAKATREIWERAKGSV